MFERKIILFEKANIHQKLIIYFLCPVEAKCSVAVRIYREK
jgi:hypothetical protein